MADSLLDSIYGCLAAGAIGDSLGAPVEGWYYQDIRREYGKVDRFMPFETGYSDGSPGTVTDDTVLRHYLCLAIVRKGGRITPDDWATLWLEELNPDRLWTNERIVLQKLRTGMDPWDAGRGTPPAGCAAMAIAPVGLINAGDPAQAYQDGFNIAALNQDGINRDAAATIAAGVAQACLPDADLAQVLETMTEHASELVRRSILLAFDLVERSDDVDAFVENFYVEMLDWTWPSRSWSPDHYFSGSSAEIIPAVVGVLSFCEADVNQSMVEGASFGRDCDTIAGIAGNIAGALRGASAIRSDWVQQVEEANAGFFEELEGDPRANFHSMAVRMAEALQNQREAARGRLQTLDRLLATTGP
jgi:ADP-ribosylglycohydrolase